MKMKVFLSKQGQQNFIINEAVEFEVKGYFEACCENSIRDIVICLMLVFIVF